VGGLEAIEKRVGSRGKKKEKERKRKRRGASTSGLTSAAQSEYGGLEGIDKRVGSWGKKKEKCWCKSKKKSVGSWGKKVKDPPIAVGESLVSVDLWILGRWLQIHYS